MGNDLDKTNWLLNHFEKKKTDIHRNALYLWWTISLAISEKKILFSYYKVFIFMVYIQKILKKAILI